MNRIATIIRNGFARYGANKTGKHIENNYTSSFTNWIKFSQPMTMTDSKTRGFAKDSKFGDKKEKHKKPAKIEFPPGQEPDEFETISYQIHFVRIESLGDKLKLAALYMQATEGPNNLPEPPRVTKKDLYEHSYWNAWTRLGKMSKEEAKKEYIQLAKLKMKKRDPTDILINN